MPLVPPLLSQHATCIINGTIFSLCKDNWNKVLLDFFGQMILWKPMWDLHDTDGTINATSCFIRSGWLKQGATWPFFSMGCQHWHHMTLMASSVPPQHLLVQDGQKEMQITFSVISHYWYWHQHCVMPMALSITPLYSLDHDHWKIYNITFWSFDAINAGSF